MNGLGRSGSSNDHLAGVAASRYINVGAGICVGATLARRLLPVENDSPEAGHSC